MKNLNITVNATWDDTSDDFNENISRFGKSDLFQYVYYGNIGLLKARELFTIKKSNKKDALVKAYEEYSGSWVYPEWTKGDLIDRLYDNVPVESFITNSWSSSNGIFDVIDITKKYELVTVKGYSQGDVIDIVVPYSLKELWGCTRRSFVSQVRGSVAEDLQHYCYDRRIDGDMELSFNFYKNCVEHTVSLEFEVISEVLDDPYELDINAGDIIAMANNEMRKFDAKLTKKEEEEIETALAEYDYSDVTEECLCA